MISPSRRLLCRFEVYCTVMVNVVVPAVLAASFPWAVTVTVYVPAVVAGLPTFTDPVPVAELKLESPE